MKNAQLSEIGRELGSDVPFFFHGPLSVVSGRGELVSPVAGGRSCVLLLVKPPIGVSTAWAYAELDRVSDKRVLTKKDNNIKLFCQALELGDFALLSSMRRNDLETPVIRRYPEIGGIREELLKRGALFSSMSGSGPTVYGVFRSEGDAMKAAEHMLPDWCRVVRTMGAVASI
jgi:4-diphosphocytidyl-2-C-methyl-D-erythritol kinase